MATTQAQIAKNLGISRATVAAALNPHSSVRLRSETRALVQKEVTRLKYRPHRYAQIMRAGKSGLIGVFHFGGLAQVAAERTWHASRAIKAAGYDVLANDASWNTGGVKAGCEAMLDAQVEGVIVAGLNNSLSTDELQSLRAARIPMVTLSGNELRGTPQVRGDARDAFERLTQHLISLGRRRLLLLLPLTQSMQQQGGYIWAGLERLQGFKAAMALAGGREISRFSRGRRGIEGRIVEVELDAAPFDPFAKACETMQLMLTQSLPPDAVLCSNDDWAVGTLSSLRESGLCVPHDVAITGYDNTAVGAYLDVPLTSVAQPNQAMAERAVDLLLKKIQGKRVPLAPIKFPCELIIRSSCGAGLFTSQP